MVNESLRTEFNEALTQLHQWIECTPGSAFPDARPFLAYLKTPYVKGTTISCKPPQKNQLFNYPYHDKCFEFSDDYLIQWHNYIEKKITGKALELGSPIEADQASFFKKMIASLFLIHEFLHIPQDLHSYRYQDSEKYPNVLFGIDYFADAASILILYRFIDYYDLQTRIAAEKDWKHTLLQLVEFAIWGMEVFEYGNSKPQSLGRNQWFRFATWHFQYHRCRAFLDATNLEEFSLLSQPLLDIRGLRPFEYKKNVISDPPNYMRLGKKVQVENQRSDPAFLCVGLPDSHGIPRMCRTWATDANNIKDLFTGILEADRTKTKALFDEVFSNHPTLVGNYGSEVISRNSEPDDKTIQVGHVIRVGVLLSGSIHYVENIFAGLRSVIDITFDKTGYGIDIEYRYGGPSASDSKKNEEVLSELVDKLNVAGGCDYLITIGTAVSQTAFKKVIGQIPIIFIGVSDPVKSGLMPPYGLAEEQKNIAGIQYGLSGSDTVAWLNRAFPRKRLAYVYSKKYPQDLHLYEDISSLQRSDLVTLIETNSTTLSKSERKCADIFFGRFFLCGNMSEFVENNVGAAFVGVSIDNIRKGAAAACGYNTFELGRLAVRRILYPNLIDGVPLNEIPLIVPERPEIGFNQRSLQKASIQPSEWARSQARLILR
ncbi:MAG TPA: ABC transporter substrate binding protein [Cyclobacteriaceae bacterium]|nr:ABC transporter substrate binding protein [Cyclobacteriaceae bacterium]